MTRFLEDLYDESAASDKLVVGVRAAAGRWLQSGDDPATWSWYGLTEIPADVVVSSLFRTPPMWLGDLVHSLRPDHPGGDSHDD